MQLLFKDILNYSLDINEKEKSFIPHMFLMAFRYYESNIIKYASFDMKKLYNLKNVRSKDSRYSANSGN